MIFEESKLITYANERKWVFKVLVLGDPIEVHPLSLVEVFKDIRQPFIDVYKYFIMLV